jgi:hypothetical protein
MELNVTVDLGVSGDSRWRAAVLAVHEAQTRYLELLQGNLLQDPDADDRALELAWLELWRAEQRRDSILYLAP